VLNSLAAAEEENARLAEFAEAAHATAVVADEANLRAQTEKTRLEFQIRELRIALGQAQEDDATGRARSNANANAAIEALRAHAAAADAAVAELTQRASALESERQILAEQLAACTAEKVAAVETARRIETMGGGERGRLFERAVSAESAQLDSSRKRDVALDEAARLRHELEQERVARARAESQAERSSYELNLHSESLRKAASRVAFLESSFAAHERRLAASEARAAQAQLRADELEVQTGLASEDVSKLRNKVSLLQERAAACAARHGAESAALQVLARKVGP